MRLRVEVGGRYVLTKAQIFVHSIKDLPEWLYCEPVTRSGCANKKGHGMGIVQKLWAH